MALDQAALEVTYYSYFAWCAGQARRPPCKPAFRISRHVSYGLSALDFFST
ncbi:MAG TPA: hypothetical protein ACQGQH_07630 [Xylella sp.]